MAFSGGHKRILVWKDKKNLLMTIHYYDFHSIWFAFSIFLLRLWSVFIPSIVEWQLLFVRDEIKLVLLMIDFLPIKASYEIQGWKVLLTGNRRCCYLGFVIPVTLSIDLGKATETCWTVSKPHVMIMKTFFIAV